MFGLAINGFFWEPSTWRVPRAGGGLEKMFGRIDTYCEYVIGWHLRNHPLLIISILAVRSFFHRIMPANQLFLAKANQ